MRLVFLHVTLACLALLAWTAPVTHGPYDIREVAHVVGRDLLNLSKRDGGLKPFTETERVKQAGLVRKDLITKCKKAGQDAAEAVARNVLAWQPLASGDRSVPVVSSASDHITFSDDLTVAHVNTRGLGFSTYTVRNRNDKAVSKRVVSDWENTLISKCYAHWGYA